MSKINERAVLVTTAHRGVFYGHLSGKPAKESVRLMRARNCLYWSADVGGFLGLAACGPSKSCKLGAWADAVTLYDVTSISECSETASAAWEAAK
jgi:hypothetical protein